MAKNKIKRGPINPLTEPGIRFHKWKKHLSYFDKSIYFIVILLLGFIRADILMISLFFFLLVYLFVTDRMYALYHLMVSFAVAVVWMLIAKSQYGYNIDTIVIFGINTFPLFAWTCGLLGAYIIYSHWEHKVKKNNWMYKLAFFSAFYIPMLLIFETVAYHFFGIHNLRTSMYSGIPLFNAIHAPLWMQISYFLIGPLYFFICEVLGLENPHYIQENRNKPKG